MPLRAIYSPPPERGKTLSMLSTATKTLMIVNRE
jgi:hypothetical protein